MTQLMCSTPPSSPTIVGSAVEKIIWPSELINMVVSKAVNTKPTLGAAPEEALSSVCTGRNATPAVERRKCLLFGQTSRQRAGDYWGVIFEVGQFHQALVSCLDSPDAHASGSGVAVAGDRQVG